MTYPRLALALAAALAATAAAAQPEYPDRAAEEDAILAEAGIVLPCRFEPFYISLALPGELRPREITVRYGLLDQDRHRHQAYVTMTIRSATGWSDAEQLASDRVGFDHLLTALVPLRDYAGAPGPAGAVGRVYRFESERRPAMVGTILWHRAGRRIHVTAWAYGTCYEAVWRDIERLIGEIATPREPHGRSRRCPSLLDVTPIPIED